MKIFNTIQELWDYCSFCPICTRNCREVIVSVGPDDVFTLVTAKNIDKILYLECIFKNKRDVYCVNYQMNCLDNSYKVKIEDPRISEPYFFFFIEGICNECKCTNAHSVDLELNMLDRKIYNIELDREDFFISSKKDNLLITLAYNKNTLLVNRADDNNVPLPTAKLPIFNLDLSDQIKAIDRIKTLILFS